MKKPSFLERLTGSHTFDDDLDDTFDAETELEADFDENSDDSREWSDALPEREEEGELPVDMFQTADSIVVRALVAGVSPDDLDVAITRDMVTIKGRRDESQEVPDEDYYHRELYWGGFTRTILLPEEVVIDESEAKEKHGLLEIVLPKVDKERSTHLKVKIGGK